ncbi:hypothetical protein FTUN_8978 (plasmid) [Frigoriglobus tundricola]|uniref:UvrD-like helicase C-terminal domain-containing protein n=1 Tax=Frigoriglobus tundricola TaxID=2774151 RepID=A0A6M5Z7H1_9BACT|nr:hypothetical protein FTUN_8978 [Frigoriglobus tundricola]
MFIAQSATSFPASSREQLYVSASRARRELTLYTSDKAELRRAVMRSDPRPAAIELVDEDRHARQLRRRAHLRRLAILTAAKAMITQTPRGRTGERGVAR